MKYFCKYFESIDLFLFEDVIVNKRMIYKYIIKCVYEFNGWFMF